jgi:transaldolase / glucose-6-phosphate isomerase
MNRIQQLHDLGQSIWYDNIQRRLLENGELADLINRGDIRGVTSNPSIFNNAIAKTHDYDAALKPMAWAGWSAESIFYQLAVEDIRAAADLFAPLYKDTDGGDGYVSLEVSPTLANDGEATASEAIRLWKWVDRPNLMVKIPATEAGLTAIRKTIAAGVNVNVTLIFSLARYAAVIEAYLAGLEDRVAVGLPIGTIASVASFFVSRVDSKVDAHLQEIIRREGPEAMMASERMGKAAIGNAKLAYALFGELFHNDRFQKLAKHGARVQRPLWASTSTKNPSYRDVLYVEELIGKDTVDTVPPQTLDAFRDHGESRPSLEEGIAEARNDLADIEALGISMDKVTQELEDEGVKAFADAFAVMIKAIEDRRISAVAELGPLAAGVQTKVEAFDREQFSQRIFKKDPLLWTSDPGGQAEVRKRLGWLQATEISREKLPKLPDFLQACQQDGLTHVLLLGMGGSSLAPEVLAQTFGVRENGSYVGMDLAILDSTDPAQVRAAARRSPVEQTLYVVASKSGGTSEVNAFFHFFWGRAVKRMGKKAGEHFIAITDPGTALDQLAQSRGFRKIFHADPSVGGRFSALTAFGVIPAALIGIDVERLLSKAGRMAKDCQPEIPAGRNPGLVLGAVLGEAALVGKDKLTILADPELASIGSWIEQLIAESTGKQGHGIIPVDLEPQIQAKKYSKDRLFVYLRQGGKLDAFIGNLHKNGHPALVLDIAGEYDLSAEFFRWEYATAAACSILGVNAFDQPDVQDSKTRTGNKIAAFKKTGKLEEGLPQWEGAEGVVYGNLSKEMHSAVDLAGVIKAFLSVVKPGDYVAINAYLPRNSQTFASLQGLRKSVQTITSTATTLGFGPRFLHSTGQLHKGGPDRGVFIQITSDAAQDLEIPEEGIKFGTLERAQALGDLEALHARDRRAIRIHVKNGKVPKL